MALSVSSVLGIRYGTTRDSSVSSFGNSECSNGRRNVRANQKDIARRMEQFFDTKLKGKPAPEWMVRGIPAKDKGKDQLQQVVP